MGTILTKCLTCAKNPIMICSVVIWKMQSSFLGRSPWQTAEKHTKFLMNQLQFVLMRNVTYFTQCDLVTFTVFIDMIVVFECYICFLRTWCLLHLPLWARKTLWIGFQNVMKLLYHEDKKRIVKEYWLDLSDLIWCVCRVFRLRIYYL